MILINAKAQVWMQAAVGTAARFLGVSTQSPSKDICQNKEDLTSSSSRFSPKSRTNQNVSQKVGLLFISSFFYFTFSCLSRFVYILRLFVMFTSDDQLVWSLLANQANKKDSAFNGLWFLGSELKQIISKNNNR